MARTKDKDVEQEIDVSTSANKRLSFAGRWFRDHAVNNREDLEIVCELTARSAYEQFRLVIPSGSKETLAVVFYGTFMSLLNYIKKKQKLYSRYTIQIANNLNIGYVNSYDGDDEKVGNFQPVMEYLSINRTIPAKDEDEDQLDPSDPTGITKKDDDKKDKKKEKKPEDVYVSLLDSRCVNWITQNSKVNADVYKEIQADAHERLKKEFIINLRTEAAVIPLFCIFLDNIANVLKVKYREAQGTDVSEVSMNVLGLFDVFYSFNDDDQEVIEFQPNITMKLALKNDGIAAGDDAD